MALEETNELVLKHSATGSEQGVHDFQSFYVKRTDDKGETHYVPVEFYSKDAVGFQPEDAQKHIEFNLVGYVVKRERQES